MALSKTPTFSSDTSEELMPAAEEGDLTVNTQNIAHILSRLTEMYPNPILASVRETVSNALDATMKTPEADRKPVEVSVGMFDDTFTVRDYGVGMSLEEVKENFLRYGSSTKAGDFEAVGAFGLGAKAPLSYTSEFTVTTTQDGVTTAFKLSNTAAGFKFAIMYSRETGRESGTIVAIPMVDSDRQNFMDAASIYQKYSFDLPVIVNGEDPTDHRFAILGNILLDADTETYGRVWLDLEPKTYSRTPTMIDSGASYGFVLSGYFYENPNRFGGGGYRYRGPNSSIVIELKPGVVDFTSSRDDIAEGPRIQAVRERIQESLDSDSFLKTAVPSIEENLGSREFAQWLRTMPQDRREIAAEVSTEVGLFNELMDTNHVDPADADSYITTWDFIRTQNPVTRSWGVDLLTLEIPGEWDTTVRTSSSFFEHVRRYMGSHYTVVTGVTKDNVAKFLRSRSRFIRSLDHNEGVIVALNKPVDSDLEGYVSRISNVENYTVDEFIAKAASVNPPSRDKAQPKTLDEITVDAVSVAPGRRQMEIGVSASTLIDNSKIVVLHKESHSYDNVHAYFENRGEVGPDDSIFVVPSMTAIMLKAIVDTSAKVYVHSSARNSIHRAKYVADFVKAATTFESEERTAYLRSVSDEELSGFILRKKGSYYARDYSALAVFEMITGLKASVDDYSPYNRRSMPSDEVVYDEFISRIPEEKRARTRHLLDNFTALQLLVTENDGKDMTGVIDSIAALAD